ncbi:MAG: grasp-with-spasm system ATP-grasp peptide maturase [Chitinophagaceae bacterium]|jgi:ATP-GRASP peptide maturase of grasp-with-spasm system
MIFIISIEVDTATVNVMRWLKYFGEEFIRLNDVDQTTLRNIKLSDILLNHTIKVQNKNTPIEIDFSKIKSYWYRRGFLNINYQRTNNLEINKYLKEDIDDIEEYFYYILQNKNHINCLKDTLINKLIALNKARELNISVPNTIVLSSKVDLEMFYHNNNKKIITKGIYNGFVFEVNKVNYSLNTSLFDYESLKDQIQNFFFPTLFQAYIEKKYELRIFYLDNDFFSSAIFSQNDEQTKIDFRNYSITKPNRINPICLPKNIKKKLRSLMTSLDLNSGSIDMIYTPSGDYVFLEVNPIGQFAQVSDPCNYLLYKKIANYLSN